MLAYLNSTPAGEDPGRGTRLQQLMTSWSDAGRLGNPAALTASGDSVKGSITDLTNRIAMLGDVRGRISLIKRDLATLLRKSMTREAPAAD